MKINILKVGLFIYSLSLDIWAGAMLYSYIAEIISPNHGMKFSHSELIAGIFTGITMAIGIFYLSKKISKQAELELFFVFLHLQYLFS